MDFKNRNINLPHPVIRQLRDRLEVTRSELMELVEYWFYLKFVILPEITFKYDGFFGEIEEELTNKTRLCSDQEYELRSLAELLKINLQHIRSQTINPVNFNKDFDDKIGEYTLEQLFDDSRYRVHGRFNCDINDKYESAQLYRQLAKKLHPDSTENSNLFQKFWISVQDSYKTNNNYRLRLLHLIVCRDFSDEFPDKKTEELYLRNELSQLQRYVSGEKKKISYIQSQEPFTLIDKFDDERWVLRRKNFILDKIGMLDKQISHNNDLLINLRKMKRKISY